MTLANSARATDAVERTTAILQLVNRVLSGGRLHFQCHCQPKRCHAEALARCIQRLAQAPREREAWSQWLVNAIARH